MARRSKKMKKYISTLMMIAMMAISIPVLATSASAQRRYYTPNRTNNYTYNRGDRNRDSFYKRHRNVINIGIATGAGAIIGGLIGGKKGALIGTAAGAGGGALYTYKINPKTHRYYRY